MAATIPPSEPPAQTWALHITAGGLSALLVIQTAREAGIPPVVHGAASVALGGSPGRPLAALGWAPVSGWLARSWGEVAAIESTH